jgi:2-keto-4-pentenoate hydratase/2-oxohepta-3-ene-1,7-dioic acid hydratase in catechol pathway
MKLVRHGHSGMEKPGVIDERGRVRDISDHIVDIDVKTLADKDLLNKLRALDLHRLPLVEETVRLGACIVPSGKLVCVGYNSRLHAEEMGNTQDYKQDMVVFLKPNSAICGPCDPILHAPHTKKLDWEAELGIVIGKKGKYISPSDAKDYIFGYMCINDLSERYLQLETLDKQFTKGKGFDNAAPIGPYLVTRDEIPDSSNLHVQLWVNGHLRQDFNTRDYIHNDEEVISYLSQYFTLYPGDIISMGSAPGSAKHWGDSYLKPGDKVILSITGLGRQEQLVIIE